MQVTEYKAEYRLSQWSEIIREQKQSGKNVREWCLEHGMTTNAYYYRLRRVRESVCRSIEHNAPEFAEVPVVTKSVKSNDVRVVTAKGTIVINSASVETLGRYCDGFFHYSE